MSTTDKTLFVEAYIISETLFDILDIMMKGEFIRMNEIDQGVHRNRIEEVDDASPFEKACVTLIASATGEDRIAYIGYEEKLQRYKSGNMDIEEEKAFSIITDNILKIRKKIVTARDFLSQSYMRRELKPEAILISNHKLYKIIEKESDRKYILQ